MSYVPVRISDIAGNSVTLAYSYNWITPTDWEDGSFIKPFLTTITNSSGTVLLTFNRNSSPGNITSIEDCYGKFVYYTYNTNCLTGSSGCMTVSVPTYGGSGSERWTYNCQSSGNYGVNNWVSSIQVPNPTGSTTDAETRITYNAMNQATSVVDPNGNSTNYTYYTGSTLVQIENPSDVVVKQYTVDYNSNNDQTGMMDANGNRVWFGIYPTTGNIYEPTQIQDCSLTTQTLCTATNLPCPYKYSWDAHGNLTSVTTPKGTETEYYIQTSILPVGLVTKIATTGKTATQFTYTSLGQLQTVVSPVPGTSDTGATQTSTIYYDSLGNITEVLSPGSGGTNHETLYAYTDAANPTEMLGKPVTVSDTYGNKTTYQYNYNPGSNGGLYDPTLENVKDSLGNAWTYVFDIADHLIQVLYPATGQSGTESAYTFYSYKYPDGPLLNITANDEDNYGQIRDLSCSYGPAGELLSVGGGTLSKSYTYDAAYDPLTIEDGKGNTTSYTYNTLGEVTQITYPGGTAYEQFTNYNCAGKLTAETDANGNTVTYTYGNSSAGDDDGLLTAVTYSLTPPNINLRTGTYGYDAYDRLVAMADGTGYHTFTYDDLDEITSNTTTYTGVTGQTFTYSYNPDSTLNEMQVGPGNFTYTYDEDGRLTGLTNPYSETTGWTYLTNSWLSSQAMSNGVSANYAYYPDGELSELTNVLTSGMTNTTLSQFSSIVHDGVGDTSSLSITVPGATSFSGGISFGYDSLGQLNSSSSTQTSGGYSHSFALDAAGNYTTFRGTSGIGFNARNEFSASGFNFDNDGNPTTYNSATATYDGADRMTSYNGSNYTAAYRFDGLRASKYNGISTTYYYYDKDGNLVLEGNSAGAITAVNTFGSNGLISRHGSSSVFYTFDDRGDTVQRLNSSGTTLDTQATDEYGATTSTPADPYDGFCAQFGYYCDYDVSPHFYLLGHRYYDSEFGRFLNQDPIGQAGGINLFSYAGNSPNDNIDPSGNTVVEGITYFVAGLWGNGGWHRGIIVLDNMTGKGAYSFAGGPQGPPTDPGNLVSRSGPWAKGTQDWNMYEGSEPDLRGVVTLISDDRANYAHWVKKFQSIENFISKQDPKPYWPLPGDSDNSFGPDYSANSNTWCRFLLDNAGLTEQWNQAMSKVPGGDWPWAPGWDIEFPYRNEGESSFNPWDLLG